MTKVRIKTHNELGYPTKNFWNPEMISMRGKTYEATSISFMGPFCYLELCTKVNSFMFPKKAIEVFEVMDEDI